MVWEQNNILGFQNFSPVVTLTLSVKSFVSKCPWIQKHLGHKKQICWPKCLSGVSGEEKMNHNLIWQGTGFCLKEHEEVPFSLVGISGRVQASLKVHMELYLQSNYQVSVCRNHSWTWFWSLSFFTCIVMALSVWVGGGQQIKETCEHRAKFTMFFPNWRRIVIHERQIQPPVLRSNCLPKHRVGNEWLENDI